MCVSPLCRYKAPLLEGLQVSPASSAEQTGSYVICMWLRENTDLVFVPGTWHPNPFDTCSPALVPYPLAESPSCRALGPRLALLLHPEPPTPDLLLPVSQLGSEGPLLGEGHLGSWNHLACWFTWRCVCSLCWGEPQVTDSVSVFLFPIPSVLHGTE